MSNKDQYQGARVKRVLTLVLMCALFIFLTYWSLFTVQGQNIDNLGMEALRLRAALVPAGLSLVTNLVSLPILIAVSLAAVVIAAWRRRVALGLRAVIVVGAANATVQLLKWAIERPQLDVSLSLANSFPSGHTAFAASVSAALVMVSARNYRTLAAAFGTVWTACMSVVVVAQGWHRPADTVGAVLVVGVWALAMAPVENRGQSRRYRLVSWARVGAVLTLTAGIVAAVVGAGMIDYSLSVPLSLGEIVVEVASGSWAGRLFSAAVVLIPLGLQALIMSSLDRLSVNAQ